ncbi:MAG: M6 family metalloprotease domain-containing protein [Dysgonamonadaceae bacterium]|jgi:M6 family metalloprotease-like protein|nr:M6 family metalloprotease domain-containing protein [Dysgonamonadaceae bacterium]
MKKLIFFFTVSILSCRSLFAVPASPELVEITLPDGTMVSYYIKGDERVHWNQSPDGYTLLYDSQQRLVYAEKDTKGNLIPSRHAYTGTGLRSSELDRFLEKTPKNLRYSPAQVETLQQIWKMTETEVQKAPAKILGDKKALCVLMGFKDKPFSKTAEEFENMMNQVGYSVGGAKGSVKDFYRENSYGKIDLTIKVVGPYTAPENISYYAPDTRWATFAREAALAADADVDFREFANELDQLETFHIIFAGYGDEAVNNGKQIWSHKSQLYYPLTLDGVKVSVYSCSSELRGNRGSNITYIGVTCHELCHVFGADDYYDINGATNGDYLATGVWDLMSEGSWNDSGRTPGHINMFQKILFGWVDPVELTSPATISNMPNSAENPVAYVIKPYTNNEMYILENRQQVGFDSKLPGKGLLIYHIHNNASTGNINNTGHPQWAYVVCASSTTAIPGNMPSYYGSINSAGAPFASTASRNTFSGTSTPTMFRWSGTSSGIEVEDKPLTEITQYDGKVSFQFQDGNANDTLVYNPVRNLQVLVEGNETTLTWDLPIANYYPDSYEVYCDDVLVKELPAGIRKFSDTGDAGHNYCVKAIYPTGSSDTQCIGTLPCLPATNLKANIVQDSISFVWDAPTDADTKDYKYALYLNGKLIQKNIENTYFKYLPETGGNHVFSVVAYVDYSSSIETKIKVTYIKIKNQSANVLISKEIPYTISVVAEPENIMYQWYYNENIIAGATQNEYVVIDSIGNYYVVLKDSAGTHEIRSEIIKVSYDDDVSINTVPAETVSVYPNPVNDILTVTNDGGISAITVTDINGRELYADKKARSEKNYQVNMSSYARGVYFIHIWNKTEAIVRKVIKN